MALTALTLKNELVWKQTGAITGYATKSIQDSSVDRCNPTISAGACNRIYFVQSTLAFGASVTINLFSVTEPTFGEALVPVRGYILKFSGAGTTWQFDTSSAAPVVWFLQGTAPTIVGAAGDFFDFGSTTAVTISNAAKTIKITNTAGSGTLTYRLEVAVGV